MSPKGFKFIVEYANASNIAQAQILASVIQDITRDFLAVSNLKRQKLLSLPSNFDSWDSFYDYCLCRKFYRYFQIKTPFGDVYGRCDSRDLPDALIYFLLFGLEDTLAELRTIEISDKNIDSYMN